MSDLINLLLPKKSAEKRKEQQARFKKTPIRRVKEESTQDKAVFRNVKNRGESFTERMK